MGHDLAVAEQMHDAGLAVVGCFHSHPGGDRSLSREDLTYLARWRQALELDQLFALLTVPTGSVWELESFVVRGAFARDVCQRARWH